MAKPRAHYVCRSCGSSQTQWMGKCPDCGAWDALERFIEPKVSRGEGAGHAAFAEAWKENPIRGTLRMQTPGAAGFDPQRAGASAVAVAAPLPAIDASDVARMPTGIGELDRVLGGGLVPGSVVLLGGDPGIGKSTLMLQAAARLAQRGVRALYVSSEESAYQTRLRAQRLFENDGVTVRSASDRSAAERSGADGRALHPRSSCDEGSVEALSELFVLADTNLARIAEQARHVQPAVCVIDSIQMIYKSDLPAAPGSITQLRRCTTDLVQLAKVSGMTVLLVGHVTKDGQLAGPKLLEHLVDAVLSFDGDRHHSHRVVRAIKNRFGATLEVGLFEMTGGGLAEVADAAALLDVAQAPRAGSVICPAMHGSRCLLVEVQALTATGFLGAAKRKTSGLDSNRLAMLIAVLEKHGGLRLADQDVFVSAVGGLRVIEPAADLALCLAIAGAHLGRAVPASAAVIGEVGLGGEVRHAHGLHQRAREAGRRGFSALIAPAAGAGERQNPSAGGHSAMPQVIGVSTLGQALALLEPVPRQHHA